MGDVIELRPGDYYLKEHMRAYRAWCRAWRDWLEGDNEALPEPSPKDYLTD